MRHARATVVFVAAALLASLAGCSSGGAPAGSQGSSSANSAPSLQGNPEQANLRMTIWSSNAAHLKLLNGIAADYTKLHPGVKVTFDSIVDNYAPTLTTQIAGGAGPDLAWIGTADAPDFISAHALVPLTQILRSTNGYDFGDLSKVDQAVYSADDELYAYPFSNSPYAVYANTDLLAKANQPSPASLIASGKWTWDELISEAAAVHSATGKAGATFQNFNYQDWTQLEPFWSAYGARPWSADGKTAEFASKERTQAFTVYTKGMAAGAFPQPGTTADFFAGDAAFVITQISRASLLDGSFKWDLVPLPTGTIGKYTTMGQAGIAVLKSSKNTAAATQFLAFMTNPTNSLRLAAYFPPPRTSQLTADVLKTNNPKLSKEQLQAVVVDAAKNAVSPGAVHTNFTQIQQAVRAALDPMWQPGADPGSVLKQVDASLQLLLGKK